jgi:hypothetical protein
LPKVPVPDTNELAGVDIISAAVNRTSTNSTNTRPSAAPTAPLTPGLAEPCGIISSVIAALPTGARKIVPAELGLQCLQSVPLDKQGNVELIEDLKLYLAWQSNLAYLKNPPSDYTEEAVDLMGELDRVLKSLQSGDYQNEYDFQLDLNSLFNRAYDNHLAFQPDILASAMQFQRPPGTELASVSLDGKKLPEIFAFRDLELAANDTSFKPSPVRKINGQGVEDYLQSVAVQAGFHDADSRWNALFPNQAITASGVTFLGSFRAGQYQGPNTTLEFANGTITTAMNVAAVFGNFTGVDSGQAFFNKFCQGLAEPVSTPTPAAQSKDATDPAPSHVGYPSAVLVHPNLSLGGYHLSDPGYEASLKWYLVTNKTNSLLGCRRSQHSLV